jgi:hypothetical protein
MASSFKQQEPQMTKPTLYTATFANGDVRAEATKMALATQPVAKASGWAKGDKINREEWLTRVAERDILPLIAANGGKIAKFRVSVGWPKGSRGGKGAESIGQCWDPKCSSDGHYKMFISPKLGAYEAVEVLVHEVVHLGAGLECKHRGAFKKIATAVGLEGKMTATVAGEELGKRIRAWMADMPEYPHGPMSAGGGDGTGKEKKPGSRLIKASCEGCEYTMRVAQSWLDIAVPMCPNPDCDGHGREMQVG